MFPRWNAIDNDKKILIAIVLVSAVLLTVRGWGLYPTVMDDEYAYSKFSRLLPLAQAGFPDYIYYSVYRATSYCGNGFLNCARIFNVIFFVSAAPFIYFIGIRITGKRTALLIAALSLLAPINGYTAYYMPESMYFFSFWVFTWLLLGTIQSRSIREWALLGLTFGLVSLVKPHAIFLLPALAGLFLVFPRQDEDVSASEKMRLVGVFLAVTIAVKFAISFALAGKSGLTVLGSVYAKLIPGPSYYFNLISLAMENMRGHLLALFLVFSIPAAQFLLSIRYFHQKPAVENPSSFVTLYAIAVFSSLLVMTVFVTASAIGSGPFETNLRLHLRYYNFAFPLLFLVAASQLSSNSNSPALKWRAIAAIPVGAAILYAIYTRLSPYTLNFVDSPDLRGFTINSAAFYFLSALSFSSLIVWVANPRLGGKIFVYVFLPLSLLCSTAFASQELAKRRTPDVYDTAGIVGRQYLSKVKTERFPHVLVVGSDLTGMYRTMFQLDNPAAIGETTANINALATPALSKKRLNENEWLLVIGDHPLPEGTYSHIPMDGFSLVKVHGPVTVDFTKSSWPGVLTKAQGFLPAEPWGTWAVGNVTLEFEKPLPEKFELHLWAFTFGPFVGKEYVAHVGNSSRTFILGAATKEKRVIEFTNPEGARTITIDIPSTISPKELGMGDDDRKLGVAFAQLGILPLTVKWQPAPTLAAQK